MRVKSFAYSPGESSVPARFKQAFLRWPPFLLLWIIALILLPTLLVGVAFAAWVTWIVMDLRKTFGTMDKPVELSASSKHN